MSKILAITNQKGGVGKTTTSVNLAASLAATKRRVLLIDMDPQGNATMGCGINKHEIALSVNDVLLGDADADETILQLEDIGFDLMPGNSDMTVAEVKMMSMFGREYRLQKALEPVQGNYDYIFIDCPPSLNMLTVNALVAATGVIIPMQCEYYALEGLSALLQTIEDIRASVNPDLQIDGILRTMYDPRNNLSNDVSAQLLSHFSGKVYNTMVPRNIRLAEAPSHGVPVIVYDKQSRGSLAYLALAGELLRRHQAESSLHSQTDTQRQG